MSPEIGSRGKVDGWMDGLKKCNHLNLLDSGLSGQLFMLCIWREDLHLKKETWK